MRKKIIIGSAFLACLFFISPLIGNESGQETPLSPLLSNVNEIAGKALEGKIVYASGIQVYIDLGKSSGIREGMSFRVVEYGAPIPNPVGGEDLGRIEKELGNILVRSVSRKMARCRVQKYEEGVQSFHSGQLVKSLMKNKLVIEPFRTKNPDLRKATAVFNNNLLTALSYSTSFELVLKKSVTTPPGDFLLSGRIHLDTGTDELEIPYTLSALRPNASEGISRGGIKISRQEVLGWPGADEIRVVSTSPSSRSASKKRQMNPVFKTTKSSYTSEKFNERRQSFKENFLSITTGDIDGDHKSELITTDGKHLVIYKWDGSKFVEFYRKKKKFVEGQIQVSAGDLDGDGKAEIAVTRKPGKYLLGEVYRWNGKKLAKIRKVKNRFLKILTKMKEGPLLMGQAYGNSRTFDQDFVGYRFKDGKLKEVGKPQKFKYNLLDMTLADIRGNGRQQVVAFDYEGKLRVYTLNGILKWKGASRYGGFNQKYAPKSGDKKEPKQDGLVAYDFDRDGKENVFVVQNSKIGGQTLSGVNFLSGLAFQSGSLIAMTWDGNDLVEKWKTKLYPGALSSLSIADIDGDGTKELIALISKSNFIKKPTSEILVLSLR